MDRSFTDNELYRAILFDKLDINEGMIMENIVSQMLRRNGHKLYFYSRSDSEHRENHIEIDFLITEGKKIAPIEVKSGNYRSHASLDKFRKKYSRNIGTSYILYPKDMMEKDGVRGGLSKGILNIADQEVFPRDFKDCSFLYCIKLSYNEVAWKYNKKIGRAC